MTFREITYESIVVRILSAIIVGGLIGLERGMKNRPAGLRTYMLVCIGSCLIMLTNQYIYQYTGAGDPMRLGGAGSKRHWLFGCRHYRGNETQPD